MTCPNCTQAQADADRCWEVAMRYRAKYLRWMRLHRQLVRDSMRGPRTRHRLEAEIAFLKGEGPPPGHYRNPLPPQMDERNR